MDDLLYVTTTSSTSHCNCEFLLLTYFCIIITYTLCSLKPPWNIYELWMWWAHKRAHAPHLYVLNHHFLHSRLVFDLPASAEAQHKCYAAAPPSVQSAQVQSICACKWTTSLENDRADFTAVAFYISENFSTTSFHLFEHIFVYFWFFKKSIYIVLNEPIRSSRTAPLLSPHAAWKGSSFPRAALNGAVRMYWCVK